MEWLTDKHHSELTEKEAVAELEHLLLNCESKEVFEQECEERFGGLGSINSMWAPKWRSAFPRFSQNGIDMDVFAHVTTK